MFFGKQVLRSSTSIGANDREASRGRSKAEFVSKFGDCLKEIKETWYWLELFVDIPDGVSAFSLKLGLPPFSRVSRSHPLSCPKTGEPGL